MGKATLFLMSNKGFSVLNTLIINNYKSFISEVIYAEDIKGCTNVPIGTQFTLEDGFAPSFNLLGDMVLCNLLGDSVFFQLEVFDNIVDVVLLNLSDNTKPAW